MTKGEFDDSTTPIDEAGPAPPQASPVSRAAAVGPGILPSLDVADATDPASSQVPPPEPGDTAPLRTISPNTILLESPSSKRDLPFNLAPPPDGSHTVNISPLARASGNALPYATAKLTSGSIIAGKYRLNYAIRAGGMGSIWHATHLLLNSPVALKFPNAHVAANRMMRDLFYREGQAIAALRGDDIVQVLDLGETIEGRLFLATEFLTGEDLDDHLKRRDALTIEGIAEIVGAVLRALGRVHDAGLVHRDIKPANIFLVDSRLDRIKLIDFGIVAESALHGGTQAIRAGTPHYMSPEQLRPASIDHRADLWATAITTYRCLVRELPFQNAADPEEVISSILGKPMPRPSAKCPVPPGFDEWFARATEREPVRRFQSADEMARALFATVGRGWSLKTRYRPYPPSLVSELEELTKKRDLGRRSMTPSDWDERQQRIDQLVMQLKRTPTAGDLVAGVRLVKIIGKGNYGTVWEALKERSGATVAVKTFDSDRLGLGTHLYHFRRGVRAMNHLRTARRRPDSVVELYETEESSMAFSMSLLAGGDLTNISERGWALEKKLSVFETICSAVKFAHDQDILHRDIKPANIVMHNGQPVLTDFDTADLLFVKTLSTQSMGTIAYAAPEQLTRKARRDASADVYSLGRMLHFLLIEEDPPILFEDVPALPDLTDAFQEGLVRVIRRCTRRDPDARYESVHALIEDFRRWPEHTPQVDDKLLVAKTEPHHGIVADVEQRRLNVGPNNRRTAERKPGGTELRRHPPHFVTLAVVSMACVCALLGVLTVAYREVGESLAFTLVAAAVVLLTVLFFSFIAHAMGRLTGTVFERIAVKVLERLSLIKPEPKPPSDT